MVTSKLRQRIQLKWRTLQWGQAIALAGLSLLAGVRPCWSAEDIIITYGFFERTVSVKELAAFARGEGLSPQLAQYAQNLGLSETDIATLKTVLTESLDLGVVEVSQFLYTVQGETLLDFLGEVIQTSSRQSGSLAIRAGIILAAADEEEGLTLLNFLEHYPTSAIRVDVGRGLQLAATLSRAVNQSERAISLVHTLAQQTAEQTQPETFVARQLLTDPPPYAVRTRLLTLPLRRVEATLYLPQVASSRVPLPNQIPVIVISHGLGDERESYRYLAEYLARRGFLVATLDHPGSNSAQIANLLAGLTPEVVANQEFLNRPEDVSTLLDQMSRILEQEPSLRYRVNLQNVGIVGQSFGGYTALALAGATFDPAALARACQPQPIYVNPSLLLQCQATTLLTAETPLPVLQDERVQAILIINPIGSALFGPSGFEQVQVPVMMMAATADTVAPALPEQIRPFTWLETPDRYLVLMSQSTHFSVIATNPEAIPSIPVPTSLLGTSPELSQRYVQTLSLAFFQRHLQQDTRYDAALTAHYVKAHVERPPLYPLSLIRTLPPLTLERAIASN